MPLPVERRAGSRIRYPPSALCTEMDGEREGRMEEKMDEKREGGEGGGGKEE